MIAITSSCIVEYEPGDETKSAAPTSRELMQLGVQTIFDAKAPQDGS